MKKLSLVQNVSLVAAVFFVGMLTVTATTNIGANISTDGALNVLATSLD